MNKVPLMITFNGSKEHDVKVKVRILFHCPEDLVSPRAKHISEEKTRRMLFYLMSSTQSKCILIFSTCLFVQSLNIIKNIETLL